MRRPRVVAAVVGLAVLAGLAWWATDRVLRAFYGPQVAFYGRVIDRAGRPVEGAVVSVTVWQNSSPFTRGMGKRVLPVDMDLRTDADGRFEVRGIRGVSLSLGFFERSGYLDVRDPRNSPRSFLYDADYGKEISDTRPLHDPDPDKPAVFVVKPVGAQR